MENHLYSLCSAAGFSSPGSPHYWLTFDVNLEKRAFSDPPLSGSNLVLIYKEYFFIGILDLSSSTGDYKGLKKEKIKDTSDQTVCGPLKCVPKL